MEAVIVVRNWEYDLDKVAREVGKRLPKWNFFKFLQTASFKVKSIFASTIAEKKRGNELNLNLPIPRSQAYQNWDLCCVVCSSPGRQRWSSCA